MTMGSCNAGVPDPSDWFGILQASERVGSGLARPLTLDLPGGST